jgi:hypothetical protein
MTFKLDLINLSRGFQTSYLISFLISIRKYLPTSHKISDVALKTFSFTDMLLVTQFEVSSICQQQTDSYSFYNCMQLWPQLASGRRESEVELRALPVSPSNSCPQVPWIDRKNKKEFRLDLALALALPLRPVPPPARRVSHGCGPASPSCLRTQPLLARGQQSRRQGRGRLG